MKYTIEDINNFLKNKSNLLTLTFNSMNDLNNIWIENHNNLFRQIEEYNNLLISYHNASCNIFSEESQANLYHFNLTLKTLKALNELNNSELQVLFSFRGIESKKLFTHLDVLEIPIVIERQYILDWCADDRIITVDYITAKQEENQLKNIFLL